MTNRILFRAATVMVLGATVAAVGTLLWIDALDTFSDYHRTVTGMTVVDGLVGSALWCAGLLGLAVGLDRACGRD